MTEEIDNSETQGAQETEQAGAQEETTPLTVEELTALVAKLTEEKDRKEGEIQRLQGITKSLQKQGVSQEELSKIHKRLDDFELNNAMLLDALERGSMGEGIETPQQSTKKSHVDELKERRMQAEAKAKEVPSYNIDQAKFVQYALGQGYDENDPVILEVTDNGNRDPKEALQLLKAKVKASSETEVQKRIAEGVQEALKKRGISAGGIESPSAPTGAWRAKSPEAKILQGVAGKK